MVHQDKTSRLEEEEEEEMMLHSNIRVFICIK